MAAAHIHSGSVEEVSVQSLSKRCIELIASGFSDISGNREQEGLMLVSAQMCYKSIGRDCCMKGMEVVFFFFIESC